jgi:hypothetical protein
MKWEGLGRKPSSSNRCTLQHFLGGNEENGKESQDIRCSRQDLKQASSEYKPRTSLLKMPTQLCSMGYTE